MPATTTPIPTYIYLNPCPFCGSKNALVFAKNDSTDLFICCLETEGGCGARSGLYSEDEETINKWNSRDTTTIIDIPTVKRYI